MKNLIPNFFTFIFCFFLSTQIFGQSKSYRIDGLFTTEDGLSHNYIASLTAFKVGIMLIGTHNGLITYDGYDFKPLNPIKTDHQPLNQNTINSIVIDSVLNIWIGTNDGIYKAHPYKKERQFFFGIGNEEYPPLKTQFDSQSFVTSTFDGKQIWMVNNGIICRFIDGEIKEYFPEKYNEVSKIVSDKENNIYAFTKDYLIGLAPDGSLLFEIDQFESLKFGLQNRENLTYLFSTKDGEVIVEDFMNKRYYRVNPTGEMEDLTDENHWFPKLFNSIDQQISQYNIKSIKKLDILETNHDLIWVATDFGLLKIFVENNYFETIPELEGINCRQFHEGRDGLIYGGTLSPNKFFIFNPKNKEFKWVENNQDAMDMVSINQDSILVIGEKREIRIFSETRQEIISTRKNLLGVDLITVFRDKNDDFWFGGRKGLYQSKISDPLGISKIKNFEEDIVMENLVRDICPIGDSLFLLASNNGVIFFHKKRGTQNVFHDKAPHNQKVLNNIISQFIKDKQGNVWIASDGGLNYLDMQKMEITKSFKKINGLSSDIIYNMTIEGDSVLWLGTSNGLSRFDIKKESFFNFFEREGIANNEFNGQSFLKTKDGKSFLGGTSGVTIIDSKKIKFKKGYGAHFVLDYNKYNSSTGMINQFRNDPRKNDPIILNPSESILELRFVNGNFKRPAKNTFSYILDGYDQNWVPMTTNHFVRFSNLEAGNYIFKLKSANSNGLENNYIFEVPIIVEEYFYKSNWFKILVGLVLFGVIIGISQYRFYIYRKRIEMRNKLARDLHDEMSNSFNNIRIIAKESNPEDTEKTKEDLYHIHKMSSEAIGMVEDVIWSINRNNNTVGDVIMKMEDSLDDVLKSRNIPFTFEKVGIDDTRKLNYLFRRNLLLIFKEAITNTVKHTIPLHVYILIKNQPDSIYFQITNIFDELVQAKYSTGLGIPGMRQRAEFINATFEIKKAKNQFDIIMVMKKVKNKSWKKSSLPFRRKEG